MVNLKNIKHNQMTDTEKLNLLKDEMQPLRDFLTRNIYTHEFIEQCKNIRETEDIEHEVIEPKQLPEPDKQQP